MQIFGITGGIGSGKSYVCRLIEQAGFPVFYCDPEAKQLIRNDETVRSSLTALVGESLYGADGKLQKPVLAAYLCKGADFSHQVDAIVHPRVGEVFREWVDKQAAAGQSRVFMECALLFESGFDRLVSQTVLIAAPEKIRLERIIRRDHITAETAGKWMSLQMPEEEKLQRADIVIVNDGIVPPDISPLLNN